MQDFFSRHGVPCRMLYITLLPGGSLSIVVLGPPSWPYFG